MDAPVNLSAAGRGLWESIAGSYELRTDELRVFTEACRETDLIEVMQSELAGADLIVKGSMGQQVMNPFVSEIRQHRTVLAALLRSLKLPDESTQGVVNQQRQAGNASWAKRGA